MFFMEGYGAAQLQAALFFRPTEEGIGAKHAWEVICPQSQPDTITEENKTPQRMTSCAGEFNGKLLTISSQRGRLDFFLQPLNVGDENNPDNSPPRMRNIQSELGELKALVAAIAAERELMRIGLVADLIRIEFNSDEANSLRRELAPLNFPEGVSDISLRFNAKRMFTCYSDLQMNRLVSWQNGKMNRMMVNIPFPMSHVTPQGTISAQPIVNFRIDINSSLNTPIFGKNNHNIINEIFEEANKIQSSGISEFSNEN